MVTSGRPSTRTIAQIARNATDGLRFHDLRHSYATRLVTEGVPVNLVRKVMGHVVRKVMGHEQTSTTLDMYTHTPDDYESRVINALDGGDAFSLRIKHGAKDDTDAV
jgi:integrase